MKIRRTILFVFMMIAIMLPSFQAWAAQQRVFDDAGLFSPAESTALEQSIAAATENTKLDLVVVTITDNQGKTSRAYADDFYDENGFGYGESEDGVLFLINMADREVYISTTGIAIRYLTDQRIDRILDRVYPYLSEGRYKDGAIAFLDQVEYYVQQGIPSNQYSQDETTGEISRYREMDTGTKILIYLLISFAVGGITVGIMAMQNKGRSATNSNTYLVRDSFHVVNRVDRHINTRVTHVRIDTNSGGGGKSSTHVGSSGRNHGGGGRKF